MYAQFEGAVSVIQSKRDCLCSATMSKGESNMAKTVIRKMAAMAIAFMMFSGCFLSVAQTSYAAPGSTTVYVTKTGKCYHSDGCASLKKSKIQTTLSDAVANGYTACSKCKPGTLDANTATAAAADTTSKSTPTETAGAVSNDPVVYLTKTGDCYHLEGCASLSKSKIPSTLSKAVAAGYKACSKCKSGNLKTETASSDSNTGSKDVEALKNYAGNNDEFNAYNYYINNADLQTAVGANGDALLKHYNEHGKAEGRSGK